MDEINLDQTLETSLTNKDFGTVREVLIKNGYALAKDESEPDLMKALQLDRSDITDEEMEDGMYLLILEKEIRGRQAHTLRQVLFVTGHKIAKPDPYLLWDEEYRRGKAGLPIYVDHNTLEL